MPGAKPAILERFRGARRTAMSITKPEDFLGLLQRVRASGGTGNRWTAACPSHDDSKNSLSISATPDRLLLKCFAGCEVTEIVRSLGLKIADLFLTRRNGHSSAAAVAGEKLTLQTFASAKRLPESFLREMGVIETPDERGRSALRITYRERDGREASRQRRRRRLIAKDGSAWEPGEGSPIPYGRWRLDEAMERGELLLVEGETDTLAAWFHNVPCLGIPGSEMVKATLEAADLAGIDTLRIVKEPDKGGETFVANVRARLAALGWVGRAFVVTLPVKDLHQLHCTAGDAFADELQRAFAGAQPLEVLTEGTSAPSSAASASPAPGSARHPQIGAPASSYGLAEIDDVDPPRGSDIGNARQLVHRYGNDFRWVSAWRCFIVWNGSTRWERDDLGAITRMAMSTARGLHADVAYEEDAAERRRLSQHALKSESEPSIRRMIELAKAGLGIAIRPSQLDANAAILNTPSGVVDLRTGEVRSARREDLTTQITAAPYDPGAHHPMLDRFLETVLPDETVRAFVQTFCGYCLTGSTAEEKLAFAYGPTASGKSTLLRALRKAMGSYATVADFASFTDRDHDGPKEDIARLAGARLVISVETKDGSRLAEGLVKWITGGDDVAARRLYEQTFEFTPQFKLLLASNYRPRARDDDDAIWRRILEVPFRVSIPEAERDPEVKAVLCDPARGGAAVLAWAVQGAVQWFQSGLEIPAAVRSATAAYRADMDPLRGFIPDVCVLEADAVITTSDLRAAYEGWAKEQGLRRPLGARALADRLRAHGCTQYRNAQERGWTGIRRRSALDHDTMTDHDAISESRLYARAQEGVSRNDVTSLLHS